MTAVRGGSDMIPHWSNSPPFITSIACVLPSVVLLLTKLLSLEMHFEFTGDEGRSGRAEASGDAGNGLTSRMPLVRESSRMTCRTF